jgi:hypothetical protein
MVLMVGYGRRLRATRAAAERRRRVTNDIMISFSWPMIHEIPPLVKRHTR